MSDPANFDRKIIITGGAGFIGSNFLLYIVPRYSDYLFVNVDCLTYAGNLSNLKSIEKNPNYRFEKADITNYEALKRIFDQYDINAVIHLAAESHVDRSIIGPTPFVKTNIEGTFNLLELAGKSAAKGKAFRFHHVSSDEVFGSADEKECFTESSCYRPNSPYAATKAGSDHLVRAYNKTYDLNTVISNCSNNYGPYQFPEKLIPLVINNAEKEIDIPVYGDGLQVRDWLYVNDHCIALEKVFHAGEPGKTYNIGGNSETTNLELVKKICRIIDSILGSGPREKLIKHISDRPGHDRRYAIDTSLVKSNLGWKPSVGLDEGLEKTVRWYLDNKEWMDRCTSGKYREYYEKMYRNRNL